MQAFGRKGPKTEIPGYPEVGLWGVFGGANESSWRIGHTQPHETDSLTERGATEVQPET